jgi:hypothetical protein
VHFCDQCIKKNLENIYQSSFALSYSSLQLFKVYISLLYRAVNISVMHLQKEISAFRYCLMDVALVLLSPCDFDIPCRVPSVKLVMACVP